MFENNVLIKNWESKEIYSNLHNDPQIDQIFNFTGPAISRTVQCDDKKFPFQLIL
jgi:hypothetical protein